MLQNIRDNAQGTIAKIIVGLIVITFALFGVESIVGGLSGEPEVASVNGEGISEFNFQRQLEMRRRQVINQMGENYDPSLIDEGELRKATLNELISRQVRLQEAADADMGISDATIDNFILQWPPAQVDGKFSREQFLAVLRNIGIQPLEFREELKKDLVINQLRMGVAQSSFVLDEELSAILALERQERSFDYVVMDAQDKAAEVDVSPEEIAAYYEDNKENYRLPEQVVVNYIQVNKDDLMDRVDVSAEEVEKAYKEELADFVADEQRKAAHILIEVNDDVSDEQALAKAKEIKSRLEGGEDFAEVAKTESDDLGSAQDGGNLGFANKGTFVPEFEEALFAMNTGEVSDPVKTDFGYHIIKLLDVATQDKPTLEESTDRITVQLKSEKAEEKFVELSTELTDVTYSASDLQGPAEELGLTVQTSKPFGREGGEGVFSNPAVLQQVFSDDVLINDHNSEIVEIGRDTLVVVRKQERIDSHIQSLAEVEDRIRARLALEKAKRVIATEVEAIIAAPDSSEVSWKSADSVRRGNPEHGQATSFAFQMPAPMGSEPVVKEFETDSGYIVVALRAVKDNNETVSDAEKQTYKSFLANRQGIEDFRMFDEKLQDQAEIERL